MGFFSDVLSTIDSSDRQATIAQLESITTTVQQAFAERSIADAQRQDVMSALGSFIRPALQQQQKMLGRARLEASIAQPIDTGSSSSVAQLLIPTQLRQEMIQAISLKTNVSANMLQGILRSVLPAVMELLLIRASKPDTEGNHPILDALLNQERNDTDLGVFFESAIQFIDSTR